MKNNKEQGKQNTSEPVIELAYLTIDDYLDLKKAMIEAYSGMGGDYWKENEIKRLLKIFPEGQLCIKMDGKVVASALSIIVNYSKYGDRHTYEQITANHTFKTHDPDGDILYGIEVFVHPKYRKMRFARRLYDARKELCENLNLQSIIVGGRIPNYKNYADKLTPRQFIDKVRNKEIYDPVLSFQLSNDFHVKKVLTGYLPDDKESHEYATLLIWDNIYYQKKEHLINVPKEIVRVGLVQWQMRMFNGFEALVSQMDYFVDAVSAYNADFVLFPEFFNAPLMADYDHLGEANAIRKLSSYTEPLRQKFLELAMTYNINIIAGSMPYLQEGKLYNVSYLCRRDGTWEDFYKIHITPSEKDSWAMNGGDKIKVFDTDSGKIGILICYDIEFPELSRLYAEQGVQILFVPFLTDTQNGYLRVRRCSQSRAIENECYVAIAGSVGNLPKVNNMDIQFAQSAIFTPSDFSFPSNAIKAEATPNTEMTIIADLDLSLLKELHSIGSVRNLKDRREDLYHLQFKGKTY
jgi:predicted amidohydrolase/GNAT superfamily N-acetyltransferase